MEDYKTPVETKFRGNEILEKSDDILVALHEKKHVLLVIKDTYFARLRVNPSTQKYQLSFNIALGPDSWHDSFLRAIDIDICEFLINFSDAHRNYATIIVEDI